MGQAIIGIGKDDIVAATGVPSWRLGTVGGYDDPVNGYQEFIYGRADGAVTGLGYLCVEATGLVTGHTTNRAVAYGWMSRAATLNQPHAAQRRDEIWQSMSAEERERAQQMANGQAPLLCEWQEVGRAR